MMREWREEMYQRDAGGLLFISWTLWRIRPHNIYCINSIKHFLQLSFSNLLHVLYVSTNTVHREMKTLLVFLFLETVDRFPFTWMGHHPNQRPLVSQRCIQMHSESAYSICYEFFSTAIPVSNRERCAWHCYMYIHNVPVTTEVLVYSGSSWFNQILLKVCDQQSL